MRPPRLRCLVACVAATSIVRAASFDDRVEAFFRPPLGEMMALSPDGRRVAYTTRTRGELAIVIVPVEQSGPKRTIPVETARASSLSATYPTASSASPITSAASAPPGTAADTSPAAPLRFLRWATENRLVYAPAVRVVPLPPIVDKHGRSTPNPDGPAILAPILTAEADGSQRGTVVDAVNFQETPAEAVNTLGDLLRTPKELATARGGPVHWRMPHLEILGFHPRDREQLIVGTHGAYSRPMQHLVDLRAGTVRLFADNWTAPPDEPQVYDWFRYQVVGERQPAARPTTTWQDADLAKLQRELAAKFPRRIVELLDWSDHRLRVLFRVTGGSDAGRIFVYQRTEDLVQEILHRAPWLGAGKLHEARWFECDAPDGTRLTGYLTWPAKPPPTPPPLLVVFPTGFPGHAQPAFDPEAQALAELGFAVARLNHRCVAGVRPEDLPALRTAADRVAVDDARTALDWIAARHPDRPFDRTRVAAVGRGFGGYLALRALQLSPAAFRAGIAFDAPLEPGPVPALGDPAGAAGKNASVLEQAETLTHPVLLLVEPARDPAIDGAAAELRTRLHALGRPPEHLALDPGFAAARPASRAATYRKIGEFLGRRWGAPTPAVKFGTTEEVR